jgi:hypothetical protein
MAGLFTSYTIKDGNSVPQSALFFTATGQASMANSMPVTLASDQTQTTNSSPFAFRQTCTASAAALPTNSATQGFRIMSLASNTGIAYIGPNGVTTTTGFPLYPGGYYDFKLSNTNLLYIIGSDTTQVVAITGS